MPLIKRKRTIRGALCDVVVAPLAFLLVGIVSSGVWLALSLVLMFFTMWVAREPLVSLTPSMETVYVMLGVIAFVGLAAIPLAIRDYFSTGGYQTVWEKSDEAVNAGKGYASMLIDADYRLYYEHFSRELQADVSCAYFVEAMTTLTDELGAMESIVRVAEIEIPEDVFSAPEYDTSIDAMVQILLVHKTTRYSLLTLYLDSHGAFQVIAFDHAECEAPQVSV